MRLAHIRIIRRRSICKHALTKATPKRNRGRSEKLIRLAEVEAVSALGADEFGLAFGEHRHDPPMLDSDITPCSLF